MKWPNYKKKTQGFMVQADCESVLDRLRLQDGTISTPA